MIPAPLPALCGHIMTTPVSRRLERTAVTFEYLLRIQHPGGRFVTPETTEKNPTKKHGPKFQSLFVGFCGTFLVGIWWKKYMNPLRMIGSDLQRFQK